MAKTFNTEGYCDPEYNYMVDLTSRLIKIKTMVEHGKYFVINRGRQYGKTTTLIALEDNLQSEYVVISMDFQMLSSDDFASEKRFVAAFSREFLYAVDDIPDHIKAKLQAYSSAEDLQATLSLLFKALTGFCGEMKKGVVLMIDEVDAASNNQVFLDFLAQLRAYYLKRRKIKTFQSLILEGVYDIRSL
ncbi:MAG: AAA-like domain-containing protein, partial [Clostridiales bacterium]|nr:AAA-like domain-containing protein [Clostridiales bacterium]